MPLTRLAFHHLLRNSRRWLAMWMLSLVERTIPAGDALSAEAVGVLAFSIGEDTKRDSRACDIARQIIVLNESRA